MNIGFILLNKIITKVDIKNLSSLSGWPKYSGSFIASSYTEYNNTLNYYFPRKCEDIKIIIIKDNITIIIDPSMILSIDNNGLKQLSNKLKCYILSAVISTTSNIFEFKYYQNGKLIRDFLSEGGKVKKQGKPQHFERVINKNELFIDDIIQVMKNFGFDYEKDMESLTKFQIIGVDKVI